MCCNISGSLIANMLLFWPTQDQWDALYLRKSFRLDKVFFKSYALKNGLSQLETGTNRTNRSKAIVYAQTHGYTK